MGSGWLARFGALAVILTLLAGCAAGSARITTTLAPTAADPAAATTAPVPAAAAPDRPREADPTPIFLSDAPTPTTAGGSDAPTVPADESSTKGDSAAGRTAASGGRAALTVVVPEAAQRVAFAQGPTLALAPARQPPPSVTPALPAPDRAAVQQPAVAQAGGRPAPPPVPTDGQSLLVNGGSNGRPEVALTFDAGADAGYAEAILDLLRDEGIVATFGMTGHWALEHPDLIERMVAEGHQLINHTWTHQSLTGVSDGLPPMSYEQLADELARTEQVVRDLTGYELKPYFRPPYGDYDATTLGWLYDLGYPFTIMWTCDTQAWRGWDAATIFDYIFGYCMQTPLEDELVLMHVGASAASDYEVLPRMIARYREQGYAFVTVEQMLQP